MNKEKICGCGCGLPLEASDLRLGKHLVINRKYVLVRAECFEDTLNDEPGCTSGIACSM